MHMSPTNHIILRMLSLVLVVILKFMKEVVEETLRIYVIVEKNVDFTMKIS